MRSAAVCTAFLGALLTLAPAASSAPPTVAATPSGSAAPARALAPQLLARLAATKPKADPKVLASMYVKAGNRTQLRLKSGRTVTLDPEPPTTTLAPALRARSGPPAALAKYAPYYRTPSLEPLKDRPEIVAVAVDHSARQTPVKDQKGRGSCVAFAVASAMESYLSWKTNVQHDISEEHMFKLFKDSKGANCNEYGFYYTGAREVLDDNRVCSEALLPYADPSECVIPAACSAASTYALKSATIITKEADPSAPEYHVRNTKLLESLLDAGFDISIGLAVAGTGWDGTTPQTGIIDVQLKSDGTPADSNGGHAMSVVGYNRPGGYFLIKNSWGTDWGRSGYGRFSYDYIQTYASGALVVTDAAHTPATLKVAAPPEVQKVAPPVIAK